MRLSRSALLPVLLAASACATADEAFPPWDLHGQATTVTQYHPAFASPYQGRNSLLPDTTPQTTADVTLYAGWSPWAGGAFYANPEIDQGHGLSDTLGAAGFPSGEAYKVGADRPYVRLQRAFFRQVIALGAGSEPVASGPNQMAGLLPHDNLTLTAGKFSVTDIFDANRYAHDPRADFLNWSVIDAGAFDYAADAWGYSTGAALEWTQSRWTLRGGLFNLSTAPNSQRLAEDFSQRALIIELEERYTLAGHAGSMKLLGFSNRGRMGRYADAVVLAQQTATTPDLALVRRDASKAGAALNIEQEVATDLGVFLRASRNDGSLEAFDFTEINQSVSAGLAGQGGRWGQTDDSAGLALVANSLSHDARAYFAAGGTGILIGDGRLPAYGTERIAEVYYALRVLPHFTVSADCQRLQNPAYNRERGPVSVFGLRLHADI